MISSDDSKDIIRRAFERGVSDYISRPFDARTVYRRAFNTIRLYAKQRRLVRMVSAQTRKQEHNTTMLVTINVDDKNISFIHPGDMVELDWNGTMFMGTVTAIDMGGAQSGSGMTTYPVTLTVDNFDGTLVDGAWLQYSFVTSQSDNCIIVPTSAVKYVSDAEGNRQSVVFVQRDSRPEDVPELLLPETEPGQKPQFPSEADGYYPVLVETGISDAENVEIISGIEEGDVVFVNFTVTDQGSSW